MNYKFDRLWNNLRFAALAISIGVFIFGTIAAQARVIDIGIPAPQKEQLKKDVKFKQGEQAVKKIKDYNTGKSKKQPSKSDRAKAAKHTKKHSS